MAYEVKVKGMGGYKVKHVVETADEAAALVKQYAKDGIAAHFVPKA